MARKDKVLDILALSVLPEDAVIARLAHQKIGKPFTMEHAKAVVNCYFNCRGRTNELTQKLFDEKHRQEKLHNDRTAFWIAEKGRQDSPLNKYRPGTVGPLHAKRNKQARAMEIAKSTFGPAVRENFNADTLALMSLISGEDRWYQVDWKDAGFKPVRSALIEVVTSARNGSQYNRFLLYKINGRVLVARTTGRDLQGAWGSQLPEAFVEAAPILQSQGYRFQSDLEGQEMVVVGPDGSERRVPWNGRTVDE
jgi:hypothetical protein